MADQQHANLLLEQFEEIVVRRWRSEGSKQEGRDIARSERLTIRLIRSCSHNVFGQVCERLLRLIDQYTTKEPVPAGVKPTLPKSNDTEETVDDHRDLSVDCLILESLAGLLETQNTWFWAQHEAIAGQYMVDRYMADHPFQQLPPRLQEELLRILMARLDCTFSTAVRYQASLCLGSLSATMLDRIVDMLTVKMHEYMSGKHSGSKGTDVREFVTVQKVIEFLGFGVGSPAQSRITLAYLGNLNLELPKIQRGVLRRQICSGLHRLFCRVFDDKEGWQRFLSNSGGPVDSFWALYNEIYNAVLRWTKKTKHAIFCYRLLALMSYKCDIKFYRSLEKRSVVKHLASTFHKEKEHRVEALEILLEYFTQLPSSFVTAEREFLAKQVDQIRHIFTRKEPPGSSEEARLVIDVLAAVASKDFYFVVQVVEEHLKSKSYPAEQKSIALRVLAKVSEALPNQVSKYNSILSPLLHPFLEGNHSKALVRDAVRCFPMIRSPDPDKAVKQMEAVGRLTVSPDREVATVAATALADFVLCSPKRNLIPALTVMTKAMALVYLETEEALGVFNKLKIIIRSYIDAERAGVQEEEATEHVDTEGQGDSEVGKRSPVTWKRLRQALEGVLMVWLCHDEGWMQQEALDVIELLSSPEFRELEQGENGVSLVKSYWLSDVLNVTVAEGRTISPSKALLCTSPEGKDLTEASNRPILPDLVAAITSRYEDFSGSIFVAFNVIRDQWEFIKEQGLKAEAAAGGDRLEEGGSHTESVASPVGKHVPLMRIENFIELLCLCMKRGEIVADTASPASEKASLLDSSTADSSYMSEEKIARAIDDLLALVHNSAGHFASLVLRGLSKLHPSVHNIMLERLKSSETDKTAREKKKRKTGASKRDDLPDFYFTEHVLELIAMVIASATQSQGGEAVARHFRSVVGDLVEVWLSTEPTSDFKHLTASLKSYANRIMSFYCQYLLKEESRQDEREKEGESSKKQDAVKKQEACIDFLCDPNWLTCLTSKEMKRLREETVDKTFAAREKLDYLQIICTANTVERMQAFEKTLLEALNSAVSLFPLEKEAQTKAILSVLQTFILKGDYVSQRVSNLLCTFLAKNTAFYEVFLHLSVASHCQEVLVIDPVPYSILETPKTTSVRPVKKVRPEAYQRTNIASHFRAALLDYTGGAIRPNVPILKEGLADCIVLAILGMAAGSEDVRLKALKNLEKLGDYFACDFDHFFSKSMMLASSENPVIRYKNAENVSSAIGGLYPEIMADLFARATIVLRQLESDERLVLIRSLAPWSALLETLWVGVQDLEAERALFLARMYELTLVCFDDGSLQEALVDLWSSVHASKIASDELLEQILAFLHRRLSQSFTELERLTEKKADRQLTADKERADREEQLAKSVVQAMTKRRATMSAMKASQSQRGWKRAAALALERRKAEETLEAYKRSLTDGHESLGGTRKRSTTTSTPGRRPSVSGTPSSATKAAPEAATRPSIDGESASKKAAQAVSVEALEREIRSVEREVMVSRIALSGVLRLGGEAKVGSLLGSSISPEARAAFPTLEDMLQKRRKRQREGREPPTATFLATFALTTDVAYDYPTSVVDYLDCILAATMELLQWDHNDKNAYKMMRSVLNSCGCQLARVAEEREMALELLKLFGAPFEGKKDAFVALAKATELLENHRTGLIQEATLLALHQALHSVEADEMAAPLAFVQTLFPIFPVDVVYGCCQLMYLAFDSGCESVFNSVVKMTINSLRNMEVNADLFSHVLALGLAMLSTESKTLYRNGASLCLSILKKLPKGSVKARAVMHRMHSNAILGVGEGSTLSLLRLMLRGIMDEEVCRPTLHLLYEFSARVMQQADDATIIATAVIATAIVEDAGQGIWSALTDALVQVVEDFFVQELATYFSAKDSDEMVANRKHILRTHPSAEVSSPECMVDRIVRSLYEASFISSSNTIEVFKLFLDLLDVAPAAFVPSSLLALHSVLLFGATFMTTELLTESLEVFYQYMYSVDVDVHNIAERCFHLSWQALASGGHPLPSKESLERPVGFVDKRKKSLQELPFDTKSLEIANRIRVFVFGLEPEQDDEEATNADEVLSSSRGVATATEDLSDQERAATVVPRPLQKGAGQAESKESGSEKASAKESSEQNASLNRMPSTLSISPPPGSPPNMPQTVSHSGRPLNLADLAESLPRGSASENAAKRERSGTVEDFLRLELQQVLRESANEDDVDEDGRARSKKESSELLLKESSTLQLAPEEEVANDDSTSSTSSVALGDLSDTDSLTSDDE